MASPRPPTSQKADQRPISFYLVDNNAPKSTVFVPLNVRPEDLTRHYPSRINPQQTLGTEIWGDTFGQGMGTINITGHTGWSRAQQPAASNKDGEDRFADLKSVVFDRWHLSRKTALAAGLDPQATVQLIFSDKLDNFSCIVAPTDFILRRSKQRPLLKQYQINLIVLNDNLNGNIVPTIDLPPNPNSPATQAAALTSMLNSINTITAQAAIASSFIDHSIAAPVAAFMLQTGAVFAAVQASISATGAVTNSLISVARLGSQAGVNIFRSLAAVAGLPTFIKASIMEVVGAYTNAFCVLHNVLAQQLIYPDYSPLYGSSNCSSTSGGRPPSALAGVNPFDFVFPAGVSGTPVITPVGQAQLQAAAKIDPVLSPPTTPQIGAMTGIISSSITVPA